MFLIGGQGQIEPIRDGLHFGGRVYLAPRNICVHKRARLARADAKGLTAAKNEALFVAPFTDSGCLIVPDKTGRKETWASIWLWDRSQLPPQARSEKAAVLPETLAHAPLDNGVRLIEAASGFEAQAWRRGALIATRWWRRQPSPQEWTGFTKSSARLLGDAATTAQTAPEPIASPWRDVSPIEYDIGRRRLEKADLWDAGVALAILTLPFAAYAGGKAAYVETQLRLNQNALNVVAAEAAPYLAARRTALDARRLVERRSTLDRPLKLVLGLKDLTDLFAEDTAVITRVVYRDGEIEARLAPAPSIPNVEIISTLEQSEAWSDVRSTPVVGGQGVVINATLMETAD